MLDDTLLSGFSETFFGYGSLNAPAWFIGMEEGGGASEEEIAKRLSAWRSLGEGKLVDLVKFHRAIGEDRWFSPNARLQPTWSKLIRLILSWKGKQVSRQAILDFQTSSLGQESGEAALLELLPLPSPSVGNWGYSDWSNLSWIQSREDYRIHLVDKRISGLRQLIEEHHPKLVVFYGRTYEANWSKLTGIDFASGANTEASWTLKGMTQFCSLPHPTAYGVTNRLFEGAGTRARSLL